MNTFRFLIIAVVLALASTEVRAQICIALRGDAPRVDPGGTFTLRPMLNPNYVPPWLGEKCNVVDSWKEMLKAASEVPAGESIVLYQGTHGGPEGSSACNAATAPGANVWSAIKALAKDHPVGAFLDACFGGDLIKTKIIDDAMMPNDPSVDRLCLVTNSQIGRVGYSVRPRTKEDEAKAKMQDGPTLDYFGQPVTPLTGVLRQDLGRALERVAKGATMESIMSIVPGAMISSAAWERVGAPAFLTNEAGIKADKILKDVLGYGQSCSEPHAKAAVAACKTPVRFDLIRGLQIGARKFDFSVWQEERDRRVKHINLLEQKIKEEGDSSTAEFHKGILQRNKEQLMALDTVLAEADGKPIYLADFLQKLKERYAATGEDDESATDLAWDFLSDVHQLLNSTEIRAYREVGQLHVGDFERPGTIHAFPSPQDLGAIVNLAMTEKGKELRSDPQERERLLSAIFGQSTYAKTDDEELKCEVSPTAILEAFTAGSIAAPDPLPIAKKADPDNLDQRRRNACRGIKFGQDA